MNIKCKSCGSDLEYDYNQIFTHWDYPYVICPKCCDVVLVPLGIKEILKGREASNKKKKELEDKIAELETVLEKLNNA